MFVIFVQSQHVSIGKEGEREGDKEGGRREE